MTRKTSRIWVTFLGIALVAAFSGVQDAQADPIHGTIDFTGSFTLNSATFANGTAFTSFSGVAVAEGTATGAYAGVPDGDPDPSPAVTMQIFQFDPVLAPSPLNPLWAFAYGGTTYSFALNSVSVLYHDADFLWLGGSGVASIDDGSGTFADTAGSWQFTGNSGGGEFGFSANTTVPEGGNSLMLLGMVLAAIGFVARRLPGVTIANRS